MSKPLTRTEINRHPTIVPLLERWRETRDARDRVNFDGRYSERTRAAADADEVRARRLYDQAVARLQGSPPAAPVARFAELPEDEA